MRTARKLPYGGFPDRDPLNRDPLDRDPLRQRPLGQRPPSPGQRPPSPGQRPPSPGQRPPSPGQRPPSPGQRPPSPGQRPPFPGQRPPSPGQRPPSPGQKPPSPERKPLPCRNFVVGGNKDVKLNLKGVSVYPSPHRLVGRSLCFRSCLITLLSYPWKLLLVISASILQLLISPPPPQWRNYVDVFWCCASIGPNFFIFTVRQGNVFTSVCHSVHGGWGCLPSG